LRSGKDSTEKPPAAKSAKAQNRDRDMGNALRSVYQRTVDEEIPTDLLDLLGQLD